MVLCIALLHGAFASAQSEDGSRAANTSHNDGSLSVVPSSCVALHRGQACFQRIRFGWKSSQALRLCLFQEDRGALLHCSIKPIVRYVHEYSSRSSESFTLRVGESGPVLSRVTVHTSWVYRTDRRSSSGWRLF